MKGVVAISFLFLVKSVLAIPGGYTAANDVVKVQLVESEWAEARRAGEFARSLRLAANELEENPRSSDAQLPRESKSVDAAEPVVAAAPIAEPDQPVAPVAVPAPTPVFDATAVAAPVFEAQPAAAASLPVVPSAHFVPRFIPNPYYSLQLQPLFYRVF